MYTYLILEKLVSAVAPSGPPADGPHVFSTRTMKGPLGHHARLLNAALPTQVAAPTISGSTLPTMGVG